MHVLQHNKSLYFCMHENCTVKQGILTLQFNSVHYLIITIENNYVYV